MIFNETLEDHLSAVESYLGDVWNVVVDYDPVGLDEYWIDDNIITINDMRSKQEQLFVLLHEAGHVIVRANPDFGIICPTGGHSKIEVLQEEVLAWEEARKLAGLLNIELDEAWTRHVRQAITKYVHWVRL
jgi:hypothetical protein